MGTKATVPGWILSRWAALSESFPVSSQMMGRARHGDIGSFGFFGHQQVSKSRLSIGKRPPTGTGCLPLAFHP